MLFQKLQGSPSLSALLVRYLWLISLVLLLAIFLVGCAAPEAGGNLGG